MSGQRSDWRERLHANSSRMEQELAFKLQEDRIFRLTQVEMLVTTADFCFPTQPRSLIVFVVVGVVLPGIRSMNGTNEIKDPPSQLLPKLRSTRHCVERAVPSALFSVAFTVAFRLLSFV